MTTITTSLSKKIYLTLIGCFFIGVVPIYPIIEILQTGQIEKEGFKFFFSFVGCFFGFSMFYAYWKNSPKITIDKNTIKIGNHTFYFKDIKNIVLTGKKSLGIFPMESTTLLFKNGTKKILFDIMYSNSSEIKLFLEQVVLNKQEYIPRLINKINRNAIRFEREETFKGNQFIYLRGIIFWGVIGFWIFAIFSWIERQILTSMILIIISVSSVGLFFGLSWTMNYFCLTKEYLIIRNHIFFWMVKIYRFSDIKEVVFEQEGRSPNCMRVITEDFRNKVYTAGTLRKKTWLEMMKNLEEKGVKVRNECIS